MSKERIRSAIKDILQIYSYSLNPHYWRVAVLVQQGYIDFGKQKIKSPNSLYRMLSSVTGVKKVWIQLEEGQ